MGSLSKKTKIGLTIIMICTVLDAFGGSIPYIGTVSNIILETITGLTTLWLLK